MNGKILTVNGYGEPMCMVCGQPVTYIHHANEMHPGYICDSPRRRCWERYKLQGPWPWRYNPRTDNWDIWIQTLHLDYSGEVLALEEGWEDTGWHLEEGF